MLIYDLEIIKAIPNKKEPFIEKIEYCEGWNDHKNMGIACLCAYDYRKDEYRVFTDSNKEKFKDLVLSQDVVIGFNNVNFDNNVIYECWDYDLYKIPNLNVDDILRMIWKSAGLNENIFSPAHTKYGLNKMSKENFGIEKTGHGSLAPIQWQQGKIGDVIDYCIHDVKMTKMLMDKIINKGYLDDPATGGVLKIEFKI